MDLHEINHDLFKYLIPLGLETNAAGKQILHTDGGTNVAHWLEYAHSASRMFRIHSIDSEIRSLVLFLFSTIFEPSLNKILSVLK